MYRLAATVSEYADDPLYRSKKVVPPSSEHWNVTEVLANPAGVTIANGMVPWSFIPVDVVPLANVTLSVSLRFLAKIETFRFSLRLHDEFSLRNAFVLIERSHNRAIGPMKKNPYRVCFSGVRVGGAFTANCFDYLAWSTPKILLSARSSPGWIYKLLFVSFFKLEANNYRSVF